MTRVHFASTSYPASEADWKGVFIRHVLSALAARSELSVDAWVPPGPLPDGVRRATRPDEDAWLEGLLARGGIAHLLRTRPMHGVATGLALVRKLRAAHARSDAELFHVNWLQNALALPADDRPALVTVLGSDMRLLRVPGIAAMLKLAFRGRRVALCPNASWMVQPLERRFDGHAVVRPVPFGIAPDWFGVSRQPDLGHPDWLCISRLTAGKLGQLFAWGEPHFADGRRRLHLFGPRQDADVAIPGWVRYHGPATPSQLRESWFPRAAGLVTLSAHPEGLPQVMLEAMAAGLPVLASRLPAHEDLVAQGETGWLCRDEAGFAEGLHLLEQPSSNAAMGARGSAMVAAQFGTWRDCAGRYAATYRALVDGQ